MEKLAVYNQLSTTPAEARKEIGAGRLKGMTDINPMWRIKALTEAFGVCGIGWKYTIKDKRLEKGCNEQVSAFVDVDLFIKVDGEWSDAIPGTGGASFIAAEKNGLYQSDECFKMALTDAIGIACKALGMSADIYFSKDRTKYSDPQPTQTPQQSQQPQSQKSDDKPWLNKMTADKKDFTKEWHNVIMAITSGKIKSLDDVRQYYKLSKENANELSTLIK